MTRDEIENAVLAPDAELTCEDARDWYGNYGYHTTTEHAGDVTHDAVEYDWLDEDDDAVAIRLGEAISDLTADETESIVVQSRHIREAADAICALLDEAVEAYQRGDLAGCRAALLAAYDAESDHGDTPATSSLAGELLVSPDEV